MSRLSSYVTFLALMGYLVATKLLLTYGPFPDDLFPHPSQKATFEWEFLAILTVVGLAGVWLSERTGFRSMWDPQVTGRQRFVVPAWIGMAFGLLAMGIDAQFGICRIFLQMMGLRFFHMKFPASALVYPGGAIIVETLYRLAPLPLVMGLVYGVVWLFTRRWLPREEGARGRTDAVFWVVAATLSLFEPVTQSGVIGLVLNWTTGRESRFVGYEGLVAYEFAEGYAFNLIQAYLFRRAGFLASLTMRISMYVIWHVVWGYISQT